MDKERFGRALGKGTRAAAKSLWEAAEAAAAPDPKAGTKVDRQGPSAGEVVGRVIEAHRVVTETKQQVRTTAVRAGKEAGKSMLTPVRRFSSVLWLEVTGFFFALFALVLAQAVWRQRAAFHAATGSAEAHKLWVYAALFLLFTYFSVSSFVRANRRSKR